MQRKILALAEGRFSPLKPKTANGALAYPAAEVVAVTFSGIIVLMAESRDRREPKIRQGQG